MSRAWEQFILVIFGAMVVVYALGVYNGISLDVILLRTLIVGVVLFVVFSVLHIWLTTMFRSPTKKSESAAAQARNISGTGKALFREAHKAEEAEATEQESSKDADTS